MRTAWRTRAPWLALGLVVAVVAGMATLRGPSGSAGPMTPVAARQTLAGRTGPPGGMPTADWVQAENAKAGSPDWRIPDGRSPHDIEGYADSVSATAGDQVSLYVSTVEPAFWVEAFRMGFYGGSGARRVWRSPRQVGRSQPAPRVSAVTHMVEAHWRPSLRVGIDSAWPPGQYLLKLAGQYGAQSYVPLTVRDDHSQAALVVQSSVTTWQAYNSWGGYSLYHGPHRSGFAGRSRAVSFDRPYGYGGGAADFLADELPLISLLEADGLDVTYWTDVDLHRRPDLLGQHRALVSLGHDEYWSPAMRQGAEQARDQGVNLAFLGANAVFRRIRLRASPLGPYRREVSYKRAKEDPFLGRDDAQVTSNWREAPDPRPESALLGEEYGCNPVRADLVVADPTSWLVAGTGLRRGDHVPNVVGYEYDRYDPSPPTPPNVAVVAHSPVHCRGGPRRYADTTYYTAPSGAGVFDAGTTGWVGALADARSRPAVTRITENLMGAFGNGPAGVAHPSVSNYAELADRRRGGQEQR